MASAMQKRVFGHIRTVKAQFSLRVHAVWPGLSLFAARIIGFYRKFQRRAKVRRRPCSSTRWYESAHFAHARRHVFARHASHSKYMKALPWLFQWFQYKWQSTTLRRIYNIPKKKKTYIQLVIQNKGLTHSFVPQRISKRECLMI